MLLVRTLQNGRASNATSHQQQQTTSCARSRLRLPQRFCCALRHLQPLSSARTGRYFARVWAAKADTGRAETTDNSGSKDKQRPDKLERADNKADSKTDSKPDSKSEKSKGSKTEKTEKADHPKPDVSATASQGLKPVHLATFFIILGTGLMFLAVLLWFTADIRFQQACTKVLRRLLKTVALRQVMGILGAMTFVRLGLEPMVKMLRRLFRAPGTWEKSSEFYILREVSLGGSYRAGYFCLHCCACHMRRALFKSRESYNAMMCTFQTLSNDNGSPMALLSVWRSVKLRNHEWDLTKSSVLAGVQASGVLVHHCSFHNPC